MLYRILLFVFVLAPPAALNAQSLGDIRGSISPTDNRSARFLNAYPQTEQQAIFEYQPVYRMAGAAPYRGYTDPNNPSVTVFSPGPNPYESAKVAQAPTYTPMRSSQGNPFASPTGLELGLDFSNYGYTEPDVPGTGPPPITVKIDGLHYGAHLAGTIASRGAPGFLNNLFFTGDTRFSYGQVDYEGSGTSKDKDNFLWDSRLVAGKDIFMGEAGFSPYVGLGYRFLFNDLQGRTSTGVFGYRRQSQYVYMPLGATLRFDAFGDGSRISVNGEYDYLILGRQKSFVNDIALGDPLNNKQDKGHGIRGSIMYENGSWSVGPFFNYWNIGTSDVACNSSATCGFEPRNQTMEYGLKASYRFWNF